MQIDDILPESNQHLRARLSANATIKVGFPLEEFRCLANPTIGNRVSHENHSILVFAGWAHFGVVVTIPLHLGPVSTELLFLCLAEFLLALRADRGTPRRSSRRWGHLSSCSSDLLVRRECDAIQQQPQHFGGSLGKRSHF